MIGVILFRGVDIKLSSAKCAKRLASYFGKLGFLLPILGKRKNCLGESIGGRVQFLRQNISRNMVSWENRQSKGTHTVAL